MAGPVDDCDLLRFSTSSVLGGTGAKDHQHDTLDVDDDDSVSSSVAVAARMGARGAAKFMERMSTRNRPISTLGTTSVIMVVVVVVLCWCSDEELGNIACCCCCC